MKKAIVFGASGFIGRFLIDELLKNPAYEQITIVVRKDPGISHPKLKTVIGDYQSLPSLKENIVGDEVFIALGTTKQNTPDQQDYYRIDHDYPVLATKLAKENGVKSVLIVSAVGANAASSVFYLRMKGETERDIIALDLDHTYIFRPSMLMGNRTEKRTLEKALIKLFAVINPIFVGSMSKYRGIEGKDVARAMINAAAHQKEKVNTYHWKEMNALL